MRYLRDEGAKAYSKEGKVRKPTTREMRVQKHTQKVVWLENTLLERWGLKGALEKKDRA
jgi:hypothetical protein